MEIGDNDFRNPGAAKYMDQNEDFQLDDPIIDEILMLQFYSIGSLKQRLELVKEYLDQKKKDFNQGAQSDKRRMK